MPTSERGSLKAAFTNFNRPGSEKDAELKLLGRTVDSAEAQNLPPQPAQQPDSYQVATAPATQQAIGGLMPRPLLQREAVRQLSFRCPVSLASELRRKAAFNQLEQQQIIVEGIRRVLAELADPPVGWQD